MLLFTFIVYIIS